MTDTNREALSIVERLTQLSSVLRSAVIPTSSRDATTTDEAAAIITELVEALRISAQAFRTLEEVSVANLEHDKARNFIKLGDMCLAALTKIRGKQL